MGGEKKSWFIPPFLQTLLLTLCQCLVKMAVRPTYPQHRHNNTKIDYDKKGKKWLYAKCRVALQARE